MKDEIREVIDIAIDVCGMINLIKDSCEQNDYANQQIGLEYAIKFQQKIIEQLTGIVEYFKENKYHE